MGHVHRLSRQLLGYAMAAALIVPEPALAYFPRLPEIPEADLWSVLIIPDLGPEGLLDVQVDDTPSQSSQPSRDDRDTVRNTTNLPLSDARTAAIVQIITDGKDLCEHLPWDYRLDCLYHVIDRAATATPGGKDYEPVRKALEKAAKKLGKLRNKYADDSADKKAFRSADGKTSVPPLQPVRPEKRAAVIRETEAILEETTTVLLRSAEDDPEELEQISRVVQAVDSTKLLLRSA